MSKLYYIVCRDFPYESFICDVEKDYGKANLLLKEYQEDDPSGNYKVQYTPGNLEVKVTPFNKDRMKQFLDKEAA